MGAWRWRLRIEVDSEAARLFRDASPEQQEWMRRVVSALLREFAVSQARPLKEVARDIGGKARERGMTPEILSSILDR